MDKKPFHQCGSWREKQLSLKPYNVGIFSHVIRNALRKRFYLSAMQNGLSTTL